MKKRLRLLAWVLSLAMLCQMLPFAAFAETEGSSEKSTFHITDVDGLNYIRNDLDANYVLDNDLDLSGINWEPIGTLEKPFTGSFDGNGHTISGLTIKSYTPANDYTCVGLFGYTSASFSNLYLTDVNISLTCSGAVNIGSLAGLAKHVENCVTYGTITATPPSETEINIGGIVARLYTGAEDNTIVNCENHVNIVIPSSNGIVHCGGIVGILRGGADEEILFSRVNTIINCSNYGFISLEEVTPIEILANYHRTFIGGIFGYADCSSSADFCRNYGKLSINKVSQSQGLRFIGGIGYIQDYGGSSIYYHSIISNSVNYANISATGNDATVYGIGQAHIHNCYNIASNLTSTGTIARIGTNTNVGFDINMKDCYSLNTSCINGEVPTEAATSGDCNGENLTKEEISAKIKEIFPNDDPFPEPEPTPQKEFTFKRDNLGFLNSSEYFFSKEDANMISEWKKVFKESVKDNNNKNIVNKYEETPAGFLLRHVEHLEQCSDILYGHNISTESLHRLVDGMSSRVKENIVLHRLSGWGGSCYGMEVVAALRYMNPSLLPSEKNSFDMAPPYDRTTNTHNRDTEDLVEFYYLQQYLPSAKLHSDNQHRLFNTAPSNALNEIVQTLKKGKVVPVAIHCSSGGFHEAILTDLLGKTDAGSYIFVVNDPNSFDPQQMEIKPTTVDDTECFESDSTQPAEHLEIEYKCAGFEFDYLEFYMTKTDQLDLINYYSNERNETLTDYSDLEIVVRLSSSLEVTSGDSHLSTKSGSIQNASNDVRAQFSIGVPAGSSDSSDDLVTYSMDFQEDGTPFEMKISPESNGKAMTLVTLKDSSFFLSTTEETAITVDPAKQTVHIETDDPGSIGLMYSQDKTTDAWPWESIAIDTTQTSYLDLTVEDDGVHITGDGLKNAQAVVGVEDSTKDIPFGENVSNDAVIRQEESGKLTLNGAEIDTPSTPSEPSTPSSPSTPAAPSGGSGDGDGSGAGALLLVGAGAAAAAITAGVVLSMPVEVQGKAELSDHTALPGAKISLLQDGKVVEQTTADDAGAFALKVKRGSYQLTAAYTDANGQIIHQTIDIKAPAKDLVVTF